MSTERRYCQERANADLPKFQFILFSIDWTARQPTNMPIRQTDRQLASQPASQIDKQTDTQTERQTNRQTDRQAKRNEEAVLP